MFSGVEKGCIGNKWVNKAIMQRSRLRNEYLELKTKAARMAYNK